MTIYKVFSIPLRRVPRMLNPLWTSSEKWALIFMVCYGSQAAALNDSLDEGIIAVSCPRVNFCRRPHGRDTRQ